MTLEILDHTVERYKGYDFVILPPRATVIVVEGGVVLGPIWADTTDMAVDEAKSYIEKKVRERLLALFMQAGYDCAFSDFEQAFHDSIPDGMTVMQWLRGCEGAIRHGSEMPWR